GDGDFMRPFAEELYQIPPERVIGSALRLDFRMDDDGTDLSYKSKVEFFDHGPEKPIRIWSRIGHRPLVASGTPMETCRCCDSRTLLNDPGCVAGVARRP